MQKAARMRFKCDQEHSRTATLSLPPSGPSFCRVVANHIVGGARRRLRLRAVIHMVHGADMVAAVVLFAG